MLNIKKIKKLTEPALEEIKEIYSPSQKKLKLASKKEAEEIYIKYDQQISKINKNDNNQGDEKAAQKIYEKYEKNRAEYNQNSNTGMDDINNIYKSKTTENFSAYKIIIGEKKLPLTPKDISFDNKTEEKKYKNVFGQELILGVVVLPKIVKFKGHFSYFKQNEKDNLPMEYVQYFEKVRNNGEKIEFNVEGADIGFEAYITQFNYKLIPGRDIEYDMTLKEVIGVNKNEIDI